MVWKWACIPVHRFRGYMEKVALYFWLATVTHFVSTIESVSSDRSLAYCALASLGLPDVLIRSSSSSAFMSRQTIDHALPAKEPAPCFAMCLSRLIVLPGSTIASVW